MCAAAWLLFFFFLLIWFSFPFFPSLVSFLPLLLLLPFLLLFLFFCLLPFLRSPSGKPKIEEEAQEVEMRMGTKVSLWSWAGQEPSVALSPVQREVSSSLAHNQVRPGLFHKAGLTHPQSQAEEVEQRDNDELLEWAGLSLLNHIKRRTGAVNTHSGLCPSANHALWMSSLAIQMQCCFFLDSKNVEWKLSSQPWPRGGNVGERAFLHGLNGVCRVAG